MKKLFGVLPALALAYSLLYAQTSDAEQEAQVKQDKRPTLHLKAITVSATRTEEPVFTTPAAVDVLHRQEIKALQPFGYQDLFKDIPGTLSIGGPRRIAQEPVIRGFQDEQVVIRFDGARQNFNQIHRGRFFIDPSLLKGVEVLRGSASAIYGSGALGGVISLTTMDPDDYLGGRDGIGANLGTSYHSNGTGFGVYGTAYGQYGVFDMLASYLWRKATEDLEDGGGNTLTATKDEIQNFLVKLGLDISPQQRLEFAAMGYKNTGRNPPNASSEATATNLVDRDTAYHSYRLSYDFEPSGSDLFDLHAVLYRNDADVEEYRFTTGRFDETDFQTTGLDIYNSSRLPFLGQREAALTYGFEYYTDEQSGLRNGKPRLQFPDAEAYYRAFYIQAQLPLAERLELVPGVRYDWFEYSTDRAAFPERDDGQFSPRVSLGFQVTSDIYLWGGYAEAFRAPSLTELYSDGVHFVAPIGQNQVVINQLVPAPNLKPEEAQTWEAGIRWRGGGDSLGAVFSASVYRSDVNNFIEEYVKFISGPPTFNPRTQTLVFPGITARRNVDARLQGVEGKIDWWAGNWSGAVIASVMEGENTDTGVGLASIPQDRLVLKVSRWFSGHTLRAGARLTLAAKQDDLPEDVRPTDGWQTLDLYVGWTPSGGDWLEGFELRVGVDNVLDEEYRVHPNGLNAPGRSFRVTFSKRFGL